MASTESGRAALVVGCTPREILETASLEYHTSRLTEERKAQRQELRSKIFELWDAAVVMAISAPAVTPVNYYGSLKRKIAAFDPYAPRSFSNLFRRLLGPTKVEVLKRLRAVERGAAAESQHLKKEIQVREHLLRALNSAESSGILPTGTLSKLMERLGQGIRLREIRNNLLGSLDCYDLADRLAKYKLSMGHTVSQLSTLHQIFEGVSEVLTATPALSTNDIRRVQREHERFLGQFVARSQGDTSPLSARQMLENALSAEQWLQQTQPGIGTEVFSQALIIFREWSVQGAVQSDSSDFRKAVASLGARIAPLTWHPLVQSALPASQGAPKNPRNKLAKVTAEKLAPLDEATPLTQFLAGELGLPLEHVRDLHSKVDHATLERRVGWLKSLLPEAANRLMKHDLTILSITEPEFATYVVYFEEALGRLRLLDPLRLLRTLQPQTSAQSYRPVLIDDTLLLLRSLELAHAILHDFFGRMGIDPARGWQEYLAGIDQMLGQGVKLSPEMVAKQIAGLAYPRNFPRDLLQPALRRLTAVQSATTLEHIRKLPGNRLEVFQKVSHSIPTYCIRVNDIWRIGFKFTQGKASDVRLVNYH